MSTPTKRSNGLWLLPSLMLALVALIAASCGGSATTDLAPAETASESDAAVQPSSSPLMGQFDRITGETIDLSDFEGENVVFWFWEPW